MKKLLSIIILLSLTSTSLAQEADLETEKLLPPGTWYLGDWLVESKAFDVYFQDALFAEQYKIMNQAGPFQDSASKAIELVLTDVINITFDQNKIFAHGLCNHFRGDYRINSREQLIVSNLAGTKMQCNYIFVEKMLTDFLSHRPIVTIKDQQLTLSNDKTTLIFSDQKHAGYESELDAEQGDKKRIEKLFTPKTQ